MSASTRPLPDITNVDYAPFWAASAEGSLVVQRCGDCGQHRWPPRPRCPSCQSASVDWPEVVGTGTVYSWTTIGHAYLRAFADRIPYTIAVVQLDNPDVRLLGSLQANDPQHIHIGAPCRVEFEDAAEGVRLPVWYVAPKEGNR